MVAYDAEKQNSWRFVVWWLLMVMMDAVSWRSKSPSSTMVRTSLRHMMESIVAHSFCLTRIQVPLFKKKKHIASPHAFAMSENQMFATICVFIFREFVQCLQLLLHCWNINGPPTVFWMALSMKQQCFHPSLSPLMIPWMATPCSTYGSIIGSSHGPTYDTSNDVNRRLTHGSIDASITLQFILVLYSMFLRTSCW